MAEFIDTLKHKYKTGSVITRLIFINALVFIAMKIIGVSLHSLIFILSISSHSLEYPLIFLCF